MNGVQMDNDDDELVDKFDGRLFVSLTLTGKDLIPDEITSRLDIKPSYSFKRGDIKIKDDGEQLIRRHGCWSLESDNNLPSNDSEAHFRWLLDVLEPVQKNLAEILEDKGIKASIMLFWITPDGRINIEVEPELLARLASLNIRVWFDIFCNH